MAQTVKHLPKCRRPRFNPWVGKISWRREWQPTAVTCFPPHQKKGVQRNTEWSRTKPNRVLPRECTGHSTPSSNNTREDTTHGHYQMVNTEITLIIFFAAKDGTLYSQQNQDCELTVAQIMNSLLPNSDLNWRK